MTKKTDTERLRTLDGEWIGPDELQQILADEGYSGGGREQYLKAVLTELTRKDPEDAANTETRRRLLEEVQRSLSQEQEKEDQTPLSDDTL